MMGGIRKIDSPPRSADQPNPQALSDRNPLKRIRVPAQRIAAPKKLPTILNKST
jgi:hypothetical protein